MTFTLKFKGASGVVEVPCAPDQPMLDALLDHGAPVQYLCRAGICGLCKAQLETGAVTKLYHRESALSEEEEASGHILLCRAQPQTNCIVLPTVGANDEWFSGSSRQLALLSPDVPGTAGLDPHAANTFALRLHRPEALLAYRPGHLAWIHPQHPLEGMTPRRLACFVRRADEDPATATFRWMQPDTGAGAAETVLPVTLDGPHATTFPSEVFAHRYIVLIESAAWPLLDALAEARRAAQAPKATLLILVGSAATPIPAALTEEIADRCIALDADPSLPRLLREAVAEEVVRAAPGERIKVLMRGSTALQDRARRAIAGTGIRAWDVSGDSRIDLRLDSNESSLRSDTPHAHQ